MSGACLVGKAAVYHWVHSNINEDISLEDVSAYHVFVQCQWMTGGTSSPGSDKRDRASPTKTTFSLGHENAVLL